MFINTPVTPGEGNTTQRDAGYVTALSLTSVAYVYNVQVRVYVCCKLSEEDQLLLLDEAEAIYGNP